LSVAITVSQFLCAVVHGTISIRRINNVSCLYCYDGIWFSLFTLINKKDRRTKKLRFFARAFCDVKHI